MPDRRSLSTSSGARAVVVALLVVAVAGFAGCSSTRTLTSEDNTKTTIRKIDGAPQDEDNLAGGSTAARDMQKVIDRLLASDDPCAILTQRDVKGYQIDPSSLASSAVLQVLAAGVIDVYNHLIEIIGDRSVVPSLSTQRDTFRQVLEVVERYSLNPTSKAGSAQIQALTQGQDFVEAGAAVATWTGQNCS